MPSRIIETYKVMSVEDQQAKGKVGHGELDDNDWVYVDDPQSNMPIAMRVSTFMASANPADRLALIDKAEKQGINCDRFRSTHPATK
jgi:hypothetical protein